MQHSSDSHSTSFPSHRPVNVLIAEDNLVNQQLLRELLEPLGYEVAVANNGRQAVSLVQDGMIDVVLMDLQMPEMDGFQATQAIRQLGPPKSGVPVIAVTSLTHQGDREACLNAGANDLLPKPVDKLKLLSVLKTWTRSLPHELPAEQPTQMPANNRESTARGQGMTSTPDVMALEVALARMGNDRALLLQLAEFFLEDAPKLLAEIDDGVQANELAVVSRAAHSLKGLAANFEALPAVAASRRVEDDGRQKDMAKLQSELPALRMEIEKLMEALVVEVEKPKG